VVASEEELEEVEEEKEESEEVTVDSVEMVDGDGYNNTLIILIQSQPFINLIIPHERNIS